MGKGKVHEYMSVSGIQYFLALNQRVLYFLLQQNLLQCINDLDILSVQTNNVTTSLESTIYDRINTTSIFCVKFQDYCNIFNTSTYCLINNTKYLRLLKHFSILFSKRY